MKLGIFSDIHSNLEALTAVLEAMETEGVERRICLGDAVGYGPFPNECTKLIDEVSDVTILGNHDSVALGRESGEQFNFFARKAIEWTQGKLDEQSINIMQKWKYMINEPPCTFVHASPRSPADWTYISTLDEAVDAFSYFSEKMCFIGHTHLPVIVVMRGKQSFKVSDFYEHQVKKDERVLVNVGSVGQPRDGNIDASWCLVDTDTLQIKIFRTPYNLKKTQKAMKKNDFDNFLIERLSVGK